MIEVEGHVAIRLAMQAHLADEEVQRLAMHALGTLARLSEDTQRAILMSGRLCIVKGMAKHNASAQLQVEAQPPLAPSALSAENREPSSGHAGDQIIKAARGHLRTRRCGGGPTAIGNISETRGLAVHGCRRGRRRDYWCDGASWRSSRWG